MACKAGMTLVSYKRKREGILAIKHGNWGQKSCGGNLYAEALTQGIWCNLCPTFTHYNKPRIHLEPVRVLLYFKNPKNTHFPLKSYPLGTSYSTFHLQALLYWNCSCWNCSWDSCFWLEAVMETCNRNASVSTWDRTISHNQLLSLGVKKGWDQ